MAKDGSILSRHEQIVLHVRTIARAFVVIGRSIAGIIRALT